MKLAYITILPAYSVGIAKKIKEKADIAKRLGLDIDFYYINPEKQVKILSVCYYKIKEVGSYKKYQNNLLILLFIF